MDIHIILNLPSLVLADKNWNRQLCPENFIKKLGTFSGSPYFSANFVVNVHHDAKTQKSENLAWKISLFGKLSF